MLLNTSYYSPQRLWSYFYPTPVDQLKHFTSQLETANKGFENKKPTFPQLYKRFYWGQDLTSTPLLPEVTPLNRLTAFFSDPLIKTFYAFELDYLQHTLKILLHNFALLSQYISKRPLTQRHGEREEKIT